MDTYIAYFDETGDDGSSVASSDIFVLTSIYMSSEVWQHNYDAIKSFRAELKNDFGMHVTEEMHTMQFLRDKGLYRKYDWSIEQRREIIKRFAKCISELDLKVINVIIDKNNFQDTDYPVLEKALTYNIQRIENDSAGKWKYLIISDQGRISPMRKTARKLRVYNPVSSHFGGVNNMPIQGMVEDVLEKKSDESYFIQVSDYISCFTSLYYKCVVKGNSLPKRIAQTIDKGFISSAMATFRSGGILNEKASSNKYGLVIYPR